MPLSNLVYLGPAGNDVAPRATPGKTAGYQAQFGDLVPVDTTAGSVTITLPPSDRVGEVCVRYAAGSNAVIVDGYGAETVDGLANTTMSILGESRVFASDGFGHWFTVASAPLLSGITATVTSIVTALMGNYQPLPMVINTQASVSGTYTIPDFSVAQGHDLTLTGNVTFVFPVDPKGKQFRMVIRQDAVGGRVITWPSNVRKPIGAFNLTLSALATDSVMCFAVRPTHWGAVLEGKDYA